MTPTHRSFRGSLTASLVLVAVVIAAAHTLTNAATAAPPAIASGNSAIVQDVDLSGFPKVGLELVIPAQLAEGDKPVFEVTENGRDVEVLKASVRKVEQPIDAVLVMDTSGSMKGHALEAAKNAARAFIAELDAPSRASLVVFADKPKVLVPTTGDAALLNRAVAGIDAGGETSLYDAVRLAVRQVKREQGSQPVVIVLSDGGDTASRASLTKAVADVRSSGIPVLAVALPSKEADRESLQLLAGVNGGRVSTVSNVDTLTGYYGSLARELQNHYRVEYNSNRPSTIDLEIAVVAKGAGGSASAETVVKNPAAAYSGPLTQAMEPVPPADLVTYALAVMLVFVSVALIVLSVALFLIKPSTGLDQLAYYDQADTTGEWDAQHRDRVMDGVVNAVDLVAGRHGFKRLAYEQLERAGMPLRPTEYILVHFALVVSAGLLGSVLFRSLPAALMLVVVTTLLPLMWIGYRVSKRKREFEAQLPDTLDLLAGSLRAGWGLQQALEAVVEQAKPPVSDEFRRAQTEVRLGRSVDQALDAVAQRIQSVDFAWVVSAITIQRDVGGNLAELLTIVSGTIRERNALKRQVSALTSEGRLSAVILFALPFFEAAVLFVMNPTYISKLFVTAPGIVMLLVGTLLLGFGGFWLNRVIQVEV